MTRLMLLMGHVIALSVKFIFISPWGRASLLLYLMGIGRHEDPGLPCQIDLLTQSTHSAKNGAHAKGLKEDASTETVAKGEETTGQETSQNRVSTVGPTSVETVQAGLEEAVEGSPAGKAKALPEASSDAPVHDMVIFPLTVEVPTL